VSSIKINLIVVYLKNPDDFIKNLSGNKLGAVNDYKYLGSPVSINPWMFDYKTNDLSNLLDSYHQKK
jgi:hypothetical protein